MRTLLKQCGWLSVNQLVFFHTVLLLFKTLQHKTPQYLHSMAEPNFNYKTRAKEVGKLRNAADYTPKNELNLKSYRWRSMRYWNQLPADITLISSMPKFKAKLKTWVLENIAIHP